MFFCIMCDILRSDPRGRLVVGAVAALTSIDVIWVKFSKGACLHSCNI